MNSVYPRDHFLEVQDVDPTLCFVVSPFASDFDGQLDVIRRAAERCGLRVVRADEIAQAGVIHADIWSNIARAAVIVADLSRWNPNVILEVGVAAATRPPEQLVLILEEAASSSTAVPFDFGPFRHIRYTNDMRGAGRLEERLRLAFEAAKSDVSILANLRPKQQAWLSEAGYHDEGHLPTWEVLSELRVRLTPGQLDDDWKCYLVAAAIQHGRDLDWWINAVVGNAAVLDMVVETMLYGPHRRPRVRAAYVIDRQPDDVKRSIVEALPAPIDDPMAEALIGALKDQGVEAWVRQYQGPFLEQYSIDELLTQFRGERRRRGRSRPSP